MTWAIVEFEKTYDRTRFDCKKIKLNEYIRNYVSQDLKRGLTKAYLAVDGGTQVIGFYTLSSAQIACHEVPDRWQRKVGVYPVPCSLIGRLAVDRTAQGKGLGEDLLMHAYHTVEKAAQHIGIKAIIVDAEDTDAEKFYLKYGFEFLQRSSKGAEKHRLFLELGEVSSKKESD